jgi:hypothetical protein
MTVAPKLKNSMSYAVAVRPFSFRNETRYSVRPAERPDGWKRP